jgi:DNA polymerase-3 subunit beta
MKGSVSVSALRDAVAVVERAVNKSAYIATMKCIALRAVGDELIVQGSDLEISMSLPVEASITEEGAAVVPADKLKAFLNAVKGETLNFSLTEKTMTLTLTCNKPKARTSLKGYDIQEFIELAEMESGIVLPLDTFLEIVNETTYAAATDESRPILETLHLVIGQGRILAEAADGFRLAVSKVQLPILDDQAEVEVLIPRRAMVELYRAAKKVGGDAKNIVVNIKAREDEQLSEESRAVKIEVPYQVLFQVGGLTFYTQVLEGRFPDTNQIIPEGKGKTHVTVAREDLLSAVTMADVFARDAARVLQLEFTSASNGAVEDTLTVSATSAESGDSEIEVPITMDGEELTIGLNAEYIADILSLDTERVTIDMNGDNGAAKIKPLDGSRWMAIQMPMHLSRYTSTLEEKTEEESSEDE